jgi:hypothetical protein
VRGFATVSNLVRSEHFANLENEHAEELPKKPRMGSLEEIQEAKTVAKQPRTRAAAAKKVTAADGDKPLPKPRTRKPKPDAGGGPPDTVKRTVRVTKSPYFPDAGLDTAPEPQDAPAEGAPKLTKTVKPRKPRAKKETTEGSIDPKQKKPKAAKPTKAVLQDKRNVANLDTTPNADENRSIWDMPCSPPKSKGESSKERSLGPPTDDLGLEQATSRRRDWTPPRDTVAQAPFTESTGKENDHTEQECQNTFTHMVSNFTYESPTTRPAGAIVKPVLINTGVSKRRRVEVSNCDDSLMD